jgi:hypothetical protein
VQTDGDTPLYIACQGGHLVVVEALLAAGASVSATMVRRSRAFLFMGGVGVCARVCVCLRGRGAHGPVNPPPPSPAPRSQRGGTADGCSPLYAASFKGHAPVVKVLLAHGASVMQYAVRGRVASSGSEGGG